MLRNAGFAIELLATPARWGFLSQHAPGLAVRDFGSSACLSLFAPNDNPLPPFLSRPGCAGALVFLRDAEPLATHLRRAGLRNVILCEPPVGSDSAASGHAAERLSNAAARWLRAAGCAAPDPAALCLDIDDPWLRTPPAVPRGAYFTLHPGSGGRAKCWPLDNFAELLGLIRQRTGWLPITLLGEADAHLEPRWRELAGGCEVVVNAPLNPVLGLLKNTRVHVGNDSGVSHLAALVAPTVALFGPTDPRVWRPVGRRVLAPRARIGDNGSVHWASLSPRAVADEAVRLAGVRA